MKKKLLLFIAIIILISTAATSYFGFSSSKANFESEMISKLRGYCIITNESIEMDLGKGLFMDYQKYADHFSKNIGARITILDDKGDIQGDSEMKSTARYDNHGSREEIKEALSEGFGVSIRKSATIGEEFVYVAAPFYNEGKLMGVTRIAFKVNEMQSFISSLSSTYLMTFLLVTVITILASYIYAAKITQPIVKITEIAKSIAKGDYGQKIYIQSNDEIQQLADTINDMAESLSESMDVLENSNSKLSSILLSMREGIVAVDMDYKVILYNDAAARLFNINEDAMNKHLLQSIRNTQLYDVFKEIIDDDFVGEKEIVYSDDIILKIKAGHITAQRDKKKIGVLALMEDVTKMSKLENMRKNFVANVSHELNTPLTSISGFVETLLDGAAENPQMRKKFLDIIAVETGRLRNLIKDLLVLSDIERGKVNHKVE